MAQGLLRSVFFSLQVLPDFLPSLFDFTVARKYILSGFFFYVFFNTWSLLVVQDAVLACCFTVHIQLSLMGWSIAHGCLCV